MKTSTHKAPEFHSSQFKRTKIIATVGPATHSYDGVLDLISAGANGLRLNFSHGTNEERVEQIKWIRKASKNLGKPVAVIQDLHGPKIQLGEFEGVIPVESGQSIRFKKGADYKRSGIIPVLYDISSKVKRGERLYIYDGKIKTTVTSIKDGIVHVRVDNNGVLIEKKGINLPDTDFGGDVIPERDKKDIAFGTTLDIDYVAQSFVQSHHDVVNLRKILSNLGSNTKIIAKIETVAALENIEQIIEEADAVMIARGDLAVETSPELVPIEQRRIVGLCREKAKPVIVATQMLATMTESSEPTRAEVSDVATAAIIGTDCVMLSDETAIGRFPVEAVKMMKQVVTFTEKNSPIEAVSFRINDPNQSKSQSVAICTAVVSLADEVGATAIVAETKSGATAQLISSYRPKLPIFAVSSEERVANQLAIVYGVKSFARPDNKYAANKLSDWLTKNSVLNKGDTIVTASGKHPGVVGTTDTIKVRVL